MEAQEISRTVAEIVAQVRRRGDDALLEYTRRWDGVELT
ncbi:MAG: histidinol dehydrogenase, partial [Planctomycetota bacterium]|nr:histidinol dehydrogenase [Planctomycetota bacterium]